jgi:predicted enzyme related to lactoylglutathione lyase
MHRSRVHALIIDVPAPEAERAAAFWSSVFGVPARASPDEPQFTSLPGAVPGIGTAVQAVDDAPRMHLDLETDDVPAEVARLVGLGAVEISQWLECHVLRAPGGQLLCVLPVGADRERFDREASTWD